MKPLRSALGRISILGLAALACTTREARAGTLRITSNPSGATVEIDGVVVGKTPFMKEFPGGYFKKPHSVFGRRLQHPLVARLSKPGYVPQQIALTHGPFRWISLTGKYHGDYWLFRADRFEATLELVAKVFTGTVQAGAAGAAPLALRPEMPLEEVVRQASPAVVLLKGTHKQATGFFLTETGIIATNRHVAEGESSLIAVTSGSRALMAKVVYADSSVDFALLKVEEGSAFPHLPLANVSSVHRGQTVVAIGNPGGGLPDTVTRGIVSAVGQRTDLGTGTWIQTDAAINPGSSGGPLLNSQGEVIGITTEKPAKSSIQGIGFALSSSDLIEVLRRFFPSVTGLAVGIETAGAGEVNISSEPEGAEIYVDGKFVGDTPSTFHLAAGEHRIELKMLEKRIWRRDLEILKDSQVTLHPTLEAQP